jgi:SpoVK/Ycf46/Vps4 family AAA+-type ATPase
LLDEFDALAKRRDDEADVGELKRLVNVLLLELDSWPSTSLLIAATNHPELLDRAVDRRFDMHVKFTLPGYAERRDMIRSVLRDSTEQELDIRIFDVVVDATEGFSFSDIERMVRRAARLSMLRNDSVGKRLLELSFSDGHAMKKSGESRDAYFGLLHEVLGYTHRAIAASAGVTHPTVAKAIARWQQQQETRHK